MSQHPAGSFRHRAKRKSANWSWDQPCECLPQQGRSLVIKIVAVLCSLALPGDCHEQTVTTSDFAELSMQSCMMGAPQLCRLDEGASGRTPCGMALRDRQGGRAG